MSDLVPNRELVVYVLSLLGGESQRLHTEDIALKCHELFPQSFSWTKYTQFADKDVVRVALTDARKERHGALVEGRSGEKHGQSARTKRDPAPDGWMLTPEGVAWVRDNEPRLASLVGRDAVKAHRQKLLKQLSKLRTQPLFLRYLKDPTGFAPDIGEIAEIVRCRVDAPENVWVGRFDAIQGRAMAADQADVVDFVTKCRDAYARQR